jgi:hypothetical protein
MSRNAPLGHNMDHFYKDVLWHLQGDVCQKCTERWHNDPAHSALSLQKFLGRNNALYPLNSKILSVCDVSVSKAEVRGRDLMTSLQARYNNPAHSALSLQTFLPFELQKSYSV